MKTSLPATVLAALVWLIPGSPRLGAAARVLSDLQPAPKRQATLDLAGGLARRQIGRAHV